jgi:UDP-glucuronate decarboxylase
MKYTAVAGGAGFIGSHLCERLLKEGQHVTCIDSLVSGRMENVSRLSEIYPDRFHIHHIDINTIDPQLFGSGTGAWFKLPRLDYLYNLACPASPRAYQRDPIHTFKTNVLGTINLLEYTRDNGIRFLLTSTSEVYGDPLQHPQQECYRGNVNFIGPRACYDVGKRAAECVMLDYAREYSVSHALNVRIARIFNTFGPNMAMDDGRVVSNFIVQALKGEDITVYGDGMQTRSLCYVDDTVNGLIKLMENDGFQGPVNLGNTTELTVLELAQIIIRLTESNSKIIYGPLPADDPTRRRPDISLAEKKLGWLPQVSLENGLLLTIEHFQHLLFK